MIRHRPGSDHDAAPGTPGTHADTPDAGPGPGPGTGQGPLAGLRVIDLTQMVAGPYCTLLLGMLGADVIKVEPLSGDNARPNGPFRDDDDRRAYGGYFQSLNRNKRSLALDLSRPEGREVLRRLARDAEVLVENYRVGVMDRLGLSWESLHALNPRLVYACIRGFGDPRTGESPYAAWPAYDIVSQAMGGLIGITGSDPAHPTKAGPGVGDLFPGTLAAVGLLAALSHARATGEGQMVDVAMVDGVLSLCERIVHQHAYGGAVPAPQGASHPLLCPFDMFPAADGWVAIAAPRDAQWRELCALMGCPERGRDPRYASNEQRLAHAGEVRRMVSGWTASRTRAQVMDTLGGRVPVGPVNSVADIFADPHTAARGMLVQVEHPGCATPATVAGNPIKLTGTRPPAPRRAPLLGEHGDAALRQLGYSEAEIRTLRRSGVLGP